MQTLSDCLNKGPEWGFTQDSQLLDTEDTKVKTKYLRLVFVVLSYLKKGC